MATKRSIDMTSGSILKKMMLYSLPLMATNILQVLFHSADVFVLGICLPGDVGDLAMGAIGANSTLITFITGLFIGISMGTNVLVAKYIGAKDEEKVKNNVGMAVLFPLIAGFVVFFVGFFGAETFLRWLNVKEAMLPMAVKYLKIYSFGFPLTMLYNFTSAVLRAAGDTIRPLIFLVISGVTNISLNFIFVIFCGMDVEGVAIATIVSQGLAALLCIISLLKDDEIYKLVPNRIRIYSDELKEVLRIGVPMGVQSMLFSIANLTMQACINDFGEFATSGNSLAATFDAIIYHVVHAFALTVLTFTGQNYGAGKFDRIVKSRNTAIILECVVGVLAGLIILGISAIFVPLIAENAETISHAQKRLFVLGLLYFICGIMDCYSCVMRGVGRSISAMIISLFGACFLRILYLEIIKRIPVIYTIDLVYLTWPLSWLVTIIIYVFVCRSTLKKVKLEMEQKEENNREEVGQDETIEEE